ncbi:hypothetical protein DYB25_004143 [Aphanomyces astaci]|uniref:PDZ domain-containing protein n=1 Tax=Aphanomyces astaci TaxID=112090 RepID=A0A397AQ85_APHAT|nr:hypothetical protein DYB25_004143 [Aphanomyces astaci]RHY52934.1 hypothetical protein DYB34_006046 [Aphanomyces astaci]RHY65789.1 hypothetical protein DYB30_003989 [Aphanomyces astaci]RHY68912.1 hypothetical protein DYB38_008066 [Aphanomyces astaci]RHY81450.1 hypothetical protein DYB26_005927 [Aphanomyces astaci]
MVRVQISKNNGFLEYKEAEVDVPTEEEGKLSIEDVKLRWAHAIYAEEDLFTLEGPHEIKLYHMPLGHDVDLLEPGQLHQWISTPSSQWVLDIFARPLITSSIGGAINIDTTTTDRVPQLNTSLTTPRRDSNTSTGSATSFIGGIMGTRGHLQTEYEDILQTTFRAQETLRKFAGIGKPVTTHSIQTTLLPLAMACPSAISRHGPNVLYQGVYNLVDAELQRGFVQAVRIWFSFDNEHTVEVAKRDGSLGLKPVRQQDGWIVVQAVPGSPCALAGMPDDEVFLTHVNGVDVSPPQCPASADKARQSNGNVSWAGNVVPLVEPCDVCVFTYF